MKYRSTLLRVTLKAGILSATLLGLAVAQQGTTSKAVSPQDTTVSKLKPQTTCPIQGDAINKKLFVDYQGKRIYVCCEGCLADVKKDPEAAIKKLESEGQGVEVVAAVTAKDSKKPDSASIAKPGTHDHQK